MKTETQIETSHYTTTGSVRGTCGHRHRTYETAERCAVQDQRDCRAIPGGHSYSDRSVVEVLTDGTEQRPAEYPDIDR